MSPMHELPTVDKLLQTLDDTERREVIGRARQLGSDLKAAAERPDLSNIAQLAMDEIDTLTITIDNPLLDAAGPEARWLLGAAVIQMRRDHPEPPVAKGTPIKMEMEIQSWLGERLMSRRHWPLDDESEPVDLIEQQLRHDTLHAPEFKHLGEEALEEIIRNATLTLSNALQETEDHQSRIGLFNHQGWHWRVIHRPQTH